MKLRLIAAFSLMGVASSFAASTIYESFLFSSTNNGSLAFYDLGATTANPDYQGSFLGSFNSTSDIFEIGGQHKTTKNNGTDVTGGSLFYRVWLTSGGATGSFTGVNMPFQADLGGDNQRWGGDVSGSNGTLVESSNIISGLSAGGYTLEVYTQASTNGVDAPNPVFNTNGGANYSATFTVVPEPSAALLGALGSLLLLRRRK